MTKLEELKAALEAATPGEWEVNSETHITLWDIGKARFGCRSIAHTGHGVGANQPQNDENCSNATFIALAHNLMPNLLEAIDLLETVSSARARQDHEFDVDAWFKQVRSLLEKFK